MPKKETLAFFMQLHCKNARVNFKFSLYGSKLLLIKTNKVMFIPRKTTFLIINLHVKVWLLIQRRKDLKNLRKCQQCLYLELK